MKTIRVLVLLLLASVHVFAPVSSDESIETVDKKGQQPVTASPETKLPTVPGASTKAPTTTPDAAPTAAPTAATTAAPTTAAPTTAAPTTAAVTLTHVAPNEANSKTPGTRKPEVSTPVPQKTASPTAAPADHNTVTPTSHVVARTDDETLKSDSLQPRSPHHADPGNHSVTARTETRGSDESTEKSNTGKGITRSAPAPGRPTAPHQTIPSPGTPQPPNKNDAVLSSDKRLWWILLPVLLVGAAAAIVLKFKCKKIHDHTETIDTGTENASFQSRPESTKDGVMLLGVKSSGGEENAAAR